MDIIGVVGYHESARAIIVRPDPHDADHHRQTWIAVDDPLSDLSPSCSWVFLGDRDFASWLRAMQGQSSDQSFATFSLLAMGPSTYLYTVESEQFHASFDHCAGTWSANPSGQLLSVNAINALHDAAMRFEDSQGPKGIWLQFDTPWYPHWVIGGVGELPMPPQSSQIPDPWQTLWEQLRESAVQHAFWNAR